MNDWLQAITNYGVTIVGLVALAVYFVKKDKEHTEQIAALTSEYRASITGLQNKYDEQIDKLVSSLDKNTLVITKLYERLNKDEN